MKRRKRINATALCSSANYVASRKAHRWVNLDGRDYNSFQGFEFK